MQHLRMGEECASCRPAFAKGQVHSELVYEGSTDLLHGKNSARLGSLDLRP